MRHDAHYVEELSQHQPAAIGRMIALDKIDPKELAENCAAVAVLAYALADMSLALPR